MNVVAGDTRNGGPEPAGGTEGTQTPEGLAGRERRVVRDGRPRPRDGRPPHPHVPRAFVHVHHARRHAWRARHPALLLPEDPSVRGPEHQELEAAGVPGTGLHGPGLLRVVHGPFLVLREEGRRGDRDLRREGRPGEDDVLRGPEPLHGLEAETEGALLFDGPAGEPERYLRPGHLREGTDFGYPAARRGRD